MAGFQVITEVLAELLLLTWAIIVILTVDILNKHAALVGAK